MSVLLSTLMLISVVSILSTFVAWPAFWLLSMRRIAAKVRAEGLDRELPGVGTQILFYAAALCFPLRKKHPYITTLMAIRQHATERDRQLAVWLTYSWILMAVSIVVGSVLLQARGG